MDPLDSLTT